MNDLTQYYNCRHMMKTGDLLTYQTQGVISSLIHIWSPDDHAGQVLDLDEYEGLRERRWTLESTRGGVHTNVLSHVLEKVHGRVYWHALKPEFDHCRPDIMCYALDQTGATKYDFEALIKFPFKAVSLDLARLLCSEYVIISWLKGGIPIIYEGKQVTIETLPYIPKPSQLAEFGVTLPPVLIVDSGPADEPQTVQP